MTLLRLERIRSVAPFLAACVSPAAHAQENGLLLDRIVNISAAYLDVTPVGDPLASRQGFSGDLVTVLSFLPPLPSNDAVRDIPPLHGIPILRGGWGGRPAGWLGLGIRVWGGTLIPGMHRIVKFDGTPRQWLAGGSVALFGEGLGAFVPYAGFGFQYVESGVDGIRNPVPSDVETTSRLPHAEFGLEMTRWHLWVGAVVARKDTFIRVVSADGEVLVNARDRLGDARFPTVLQLSLGYRGMEGVVVGLSEVWVPSRLYMPRLIFGMTF